MKQNRKMSTWNRLNLVSLGSWPTIYAQKPHGHWPEDAPIIKRKGGGIIIATLIKYLIPTLYFASANEGMLRKAYNKQFFKGLRFLHEPCGGVI
jgi:hypothetical protein